MRKATTLLVAAATLSAAAVATSHQAKADCWECWVGGAVLGGVLVAGTAYASGYYAGSYGPYYGYAPRTYGYAPVSTFGYYSPPYYDYGPDYYRPAPVRHVKRVRYVRQEYVEPVYYEAPQRVYYQSAPQPNYVRARY
jgi:hypothetical protein